MSNNASLQETPSQPVRVLAVDDEVYNLEILEELLQDAGYLVDTATGGLEAKEKLLRDPQAYQTVLLDRMMPDLDGLQLLEFMKTHPQLHLVPVIMQTAKATLTDIQQGLSAGVIYYLTKPFEQETLLAIVDTTVSAYLQRTELCQALPSVKKDLLQTCREFRVSNLEDARNVATLLASACPNPQRVITGLCELLVNAIEHGNLEIGYDKKSQLLATGQWREEIERRLQEQAYKDRQVHVSFESNDKEINIHIRDQGKGFESEQYLEIDPVRVVNTHGRGIAIARSLSFDRLEFIGAGNEVIATVLKDRGRIL